MRREKKKGYNWKNIVPMVAGSLKLGQTIVTKRFVTKEEAERYSQQDGAWLIILLAFIFLGIGIPLLIGYLIKN